MMIVAARQDPGSAAELPQAATVPGVMEISMQCTVARDAGRKGRVSPGVIPGDAVQVICDAMTIRSGLPPAAGKGRGLRLEGASSTGRWRRGPCRKGSASVREFRVHDPRSPGMKAARSTSRDDGDTLGFDLFPPPLRSS